MYFNLRLAPRQTLKIASIATKKNGAKRGKPGLPFVRRKQGVWNAVSVCHAEAARVLF